MDKIYFPIEPLYKRLRGEDIKNEEKKKKTEVVDEKINPQASKEDLLKNQWVETEMLKKMIEEEEESKLE